MSCSFREELYRVWVIPTVAINRKEHFMTIQSIKQHKQWLVPIAILLMVASAFIVRTAFAKVTFNTIDPVGLVADQGRHITVTGPISCDAGDRAELRVTLTQRSTGAVAEGRALITGTGEVQQWEVETVVEGGATFEAGPATAVAVARTTVKGRSTDAHQWLVNITLLKE
jgi:hypothetical protein